MMERVLASSCSSCTILSSVTGRRGLPTGMKVNASLEAGSGCGGGEAACRLTDDVSLTSEGFRGLTVGYVGILGLLLSGFRIS